MNPTKMNELERTATEGESPERELSHFRYYKNQNKNTPLTEFLAEYNQSHPYPPITSEDVRIGPPFHDCGTAYPEYCQTGFHFSYEYHKWAARESVGVYIYGAESQPENLEEVLRIIERERYYENMSIRTSRRNDYEAFIVHHSELLEIIQKTAQVNNWEFEEISREEVSQKMRLGYLTVEGFTYSILDERGMVLYDKEGRRIDYDANPEFHARVQRILARPIIEKLDHEEKDWNEEWTYPDYDSGPD